MNWTGLLGTFAAYHGPKVIIREDLLFTVMAGLLRSGLALTKEVSDKAESSIAA
jgi:hypothetical protein